ncbi:MAG: serine/threonine protein kinase [Deltaproteobacteria bacterium]|nr:serine/threonine protein kinase [Deltaproteobacteria bacterium]
MLDAFTVFGRPNGDFVTPPAPRLSAPPDPLIGTLFAGKYEVTKKLGEGGMGSVYLALQKPLDRQVAIKVLLGKLANDDVAVRRFDQEAKAISKMQHPNTVMIYDYGRTDDGRLYIVMEFLKGRALSDALRKDGAFDPARTIGIVRNICASLADAHAAGIIHRDLKPDNIFLTEVGGTKDWVKVLDFGVAKLADNEAAMTLTATGMIFGTPKYMSPEQAEGKHIDFRADIYAIGVVMFEMLAARPPFLAETPVQLLLKHIQQPPPYLKEIRPDLVIPSEVEGIVRKALEKHPDNRFQSVNEMSVALDRTLRTMATGAFPIASAGPLPGGDARPSPTEVVPGQLPSVVPMLAPPDRVPTGLSTGLPVGARDGPPTLQHQLPSNVPTAMTAAQSAAAQTAQTRAAEAAFSGFAPTSQTAPLRADGPALDTLGGYDVSGPLSTAKKSNLGLVIGGGAAIALAAAAAIIVMQMAGPTVSTIAIEPVVSPTPDPTPPPVPTPVAPTPEPTPTPAPAPEKKPMLAQRKPTKGAETTTQEEPAEEAPATKVFFRFESTPPGAIVETESGAQLGKTPFTREFPLDSDVGIFFFKLDGYEAARQTAVYSSDKVLRADLVKTAEKPVETKPATPVTKPADPPKKKPDKDELNERVDDLKDI